MKGTAASTILAPIAWGTTYVVVTELMPAGRPLLVALLRVLPAGTVLAILGIVRSRYLPHGIEWARTASLGLANFGAFFPLLFIAVYRLPGGVAAAVGGIQPLLVLALTALIAGERPAARDVTVGVVAVVGVGLVVVRPGAAADPLGVLAAVGANVAFALGVVLTRRFPPPRDRLGAVGWQLLVGAAVLFPLALLAERGAPVVDGPAVAGTAYLSLAATALAYVLWFRGVGRLPAIAPPLLGLASPVTGAAMGWLVLDQNLAPVQLIGFVVTLAAIAYGAATPGAVGQRAPGDAVRGVVTLRRP